MYDTIHLYAVIYLGGGGVCCFCGCNFNKVLHSIFVRWVLSNQSKHFAKKYNTLTDAKDKLNVDYITSTQHIRSTLDQVQSTPQQTAVIDDPLSPVFQSSPLLKEQNEQNLVGDVAQDFLKCFKGPMLSRLKMQVMQYLFQLTVVEFVDMAV